MSNRFFLIVLGLYIIFLPHRGNIVGQEFPKVQYKAESPGVPAAPDKLELTQPDGSIIHVYFKGDGAVNWYETTDGYTIMKNDKGIFEYAKLDEKGELVNSNVKAHNPREREGFEASYLSGIKKGVMYSSSQIEKLKSNFKSKPTKGPSKAFPHIGTNNLLVILVDFPDVTNTYGQSTFDNMMNQTGYNGTGSFKDYYIANSYGQLTVVTTVNGWYTAGNNHDYYCHSCSGANSNVTYRQLVREAVDSAEKAGVDFSVYDNDLDGEVDGVMVIHAGNGAEYGDNTNVWSHSWSLSAWTPDYSVTYDGVLIDAYTLNPETTPYGLGTIGVLCHEFGHNLGLPDYYDTDYEGSGGQSFDLGDWDCMAGGSYNNGGATPASHNNFSKVMLDWVVPVELDESQMVTLPNLAENNISYYYTTPTTDEYFFVENRQQVPGTFDEYVPSHGMLVYHVDLNYSGWSSNDINVDPTHNAMDIEEADNLRTSGSVSGDPFPGSSGNKSFTDATTPNSHDWSGASTNKPITNIIESAGVITFAFMGGDTLNPRGFIAIPFSTDQINLSWTLNNSGHNVVLAWSGDGIFGTPADGDSYSAGNTIPGGGTVLYNGSSTSYSHSELTPSTRYYYKIWSYDGSHVYSTGTVTDATTFCDIITDLPFVEDFSGGTLPTCWQNVDNEGSGQVWEFDNPGGRTINTTTNANGFVILDSDEYGSGYSQNADLISPVMDLSMCDSVFVTFEHYFRSWSDSKGTFSYSVNGGISWVEVQNWTGSSTSNATTFYQDLTSELSGQSFVAFKWNYVGDYGYYWAIDDILIDSVNPGYTPPQYDVTFIIVNDDGSYPIENANVTLTGYGSVNTNASGSATFNNVTQQYSLPYSVSASSYITVNATIDVDGEIYQWVYLDTAISAGYNVTFTVDDGTNPINGASVYMTGYGTQTTNVSGQTVFNNVSPDDDIVYNISATGFEDIIDSVDVMDSDVNLDITMLPLTYTVGFFVWGEVDSLAGAIVTLDGYGTQVTNIYGRVHFNGVDTEDDIAFTVNADGYYQFDSIVDVIDSDVDVTVYLTPLEYEVTFIVSSGGSFIDSAMVYLGEGDSAYTNTLGEAIFNISPQNDVAYLVTKDGYRDASGTIDITEDRTVNVTITNLADPVYLVTFNITDGSSPIEGAGVTLSGYGEKITNSSGQVVYNEVGVASDINFIITADDYFDYVDSLDVVDANVTENITMTLVSYSVTFNVDDGTNPIQNAHVTLAGYGSKNTNSSGQAVFNNVVPENNIGYEVEATNFENSSGSVNVSSKNISRSIHLVSTGIKDVEMSNLITLFPNPTSGKVWFKGSLPYEIEVKVYDITGIMVMNKTLYGNYLIDLSMYASGTYFIQTKMGEEIGYHKLILKK
ncbi:MAG: M6 family metalloprotease domain-containing protein [Bacteroidales bacterium]|nr:M6 family metalloprotease domain-containing protein [Bacteroidales bacterium]